MRNNSPHNNFTQPERQYHLMRQKIYQALVNRHIGISKRYHKMHDGASGIKHPLSWLYLLWLNLAYYVFHVKKLGKMPEAGAYEEKHLPVSGSESELFLSDYPNLSVQSFVNELMKQSYPLIYLTPLFLDHFHHRMTCFLCCRMSLS